MSYEVQIMSKDKYLSIFLPQMEAIDPWPLRAKGLIVLVSPNWSDRKGNNKVIKCKLKKYLFRGKKRKTNFATR